MVLKTDKELEELKPMLAEMAQTCTDMLELSIKSLLERDNVLCEQVFKLDQKVNKLDIEIDKQCIKLLALFEPKAIDLRYVLTAARIITDLERIGDHCVEICKNVMVVNEYPQIKPYVDIPNMGTASAKMIHDAMNSFFKKDTSLAIEVIKSDDYVDDTNKQIIRELFTYFIEDIRKTQAIVALIRIAESLERVADHATNIAEMAYYMVEAKIIRHKSLKEIES